MGTVAWRNWRAARRREGDASPHFEDVLYSDARFLGEQVILGPYTVITTMADPAPMMPALVLRGEMLVDSMPELVDRATGKLAPADSRAYHGGTSTDEIAALLSLTFGVRCRAGGTVRVWNLRQDPFGSPVHWDANALHRPGPPGAEVLPAVSSRAAPLADAQDLLNTFPDLSSKKAVALIRAARQYSSALWWANEDPNFAWLQLVGAVEVVANTRPSRTLPGTAVESLEELAPTIWQALDGADDEVKQRVAQVMVGTLRALRKFKVFVQDHLPEPPQPRPEVYACVDWAHMGALMGIVYEHRSRALHDGTPFPQPMLWQPHRDESGKIAERPMGMSAAGLGGSWMAEELPMTLQTFEHVVRGSLLKWWRDQVENRQMP